MKRSYLKKMSKKRQDLTEDIKKDNIEMWKFFYEIWENSPHNCQSCGCSLGPIPTTYMFDHLLEKSKYPELKFEKNNIFLCCLKCHNSKTNGHPTEKHQEAINKAKELLEDFNEFKERIEFENKLLNIK